MVQQTLKSPTDLLHFQLRTALTMENDSLAALGELAKAARSAEIKKLFRHHADETKEQIANLQQVFQLLELKETTAPSPSTKGISQAGGLAARAERSEAARPGRPLERPGQRALRDLRLPGVDRADLGDGTLRSGGAATGEPRPGGPHQRGAADDVGEDPRVSPAVRRNADALALAHSKRSLSKPTVR